MHTITWCRVGVSARTWKAVKSLGVPKPVGCSQSTPTSLLAASGSASDQLLELGVQPGPGHQVRGGRRADLFGEFGEAAVLLGGENALLDAQFAKRDLEDFEVGDLVHHRCGGAIVIVIVIVMSSPSECCAAPFRRFEPPLGDLGLQRVVAGPGVAVPELGQLEPNDVEPLGFLVGPVPGLVLGRGAFVGDDGDLTFRAAHVLLGAGVEAGREAPAPRPRRRPGTSARPACPANTCGSPLPTACLWCPLRLTASRVTFELRLGLQRLPCSPPSYRALTSAMRSASSLRPMWCFSTRMRATASSHRP